MSGSVSVRHPITVEQYEQFEGYSGLRDELIFGEIVMSPRAKPLHQQISKNIERLLDALLEDSIYVAQRDTNITFAAANSMPSPEVFVALRSDWKKACEEDVYLSTVPVLVVEVLSPANRPRRVAQKLSLYLNAGVACVWLVDPGKQSVRAHYGSSEITYGGPADEVPLCSPLSGQIALQRSSRRSASSHHNSECSGLVTVSTTRILPVPATPHTPSR